MRRISIAWRRQVPKYPTAFCRRYTNAPTLFTRLSATATSDPLAELKAAITAAKEQVRRRDADVAAITAYIAEPDKGRRPIPIDADNATKVLWSHSTWTEQDLDRAKQDLRDAEQRVRDAKQDLDRAEQRLDVDTPEKLCAFYHSGTHRPQCVNKGRLARMCGGLYNVTDAEESVRKAAQTMGSACPNDDVRLPLPAVIAASGQGKSEFLKHLYFDDKMHRTIIDAYNSRRPADATRATAVLPLYVTFNDTVGYDVKEPGVGALINRIVAQYYGVLPDMRVSSPCDAMSLGALLQHLVFLREQELQTSGVLALLLVDEVLAVRRKSQEEISRILNAVCNTIDPTKTSFLYLPVVSSLQVDSLFSNVTTHSKRPLLGIRLFPCPNRVLPDMVDKVTKHLDVGPKSSSERLRMTRLYGGRYRDLEKAVVDMEPPEATLASSQADQLLEVLRYVLQHPNTFDVESTKIGKETIWETVSSNLYGVFYRKVDVTNNTVQLAVTPIVMLRYAQRTEGCQKWRRLFSELAAVLLPGGGTKEGFAKAWELAVPIAEALYTGITGQLPPYLREIAELRVTEGNYFDTDVHYPEGGLAECFDKLLEDLKCGKRLISYPNISNFRGAEGGHTLYGARLVFQMKLWAAVSWNQLEGIITKLIAVTTETDSIGVLYVTGATTECISAANKKYKSRKIYVISGEEVLSTLQPLIGTYIPDNITK